MRPWLHLRPLSKAELRQPDLVAAVAAFRRARRQARLKRQDLIDLPPAQAELVRPLLSEGKVDARPHRGSGSRFAGAALRAIRARPVNARGEPQR